MKCEACLDLLEEYFDGELADVDASRVSEHLMTCSECNTAFATLTAEQDLFARYDRDIEVPPTLWNAIAERTAPIHVDSNNGLLSWFAGLFTVRLLSFAGAAAVLLLAVLIGVSYVVMKKPVDDNTFAVKQDPPKTVPAVPDGQKSEDKQEVVRGPGTVERHDSPHKVQVKKKRASEPTPVTVIDQSDVISTDLGFDLEDQDTAKHLEQTQNLLRSIRNVKVADDDDEVDVSYDKALSRKLLNENIVLRRDAEMKAKYPTKSLLSDVEPFLIDIANLPDRAKPDEVRTIQERVQKTEIVAALSEYQGRGLDR